MANEVSAAGTTRDLAPAAQLSLDPARRADSRCALDSSRRALSWLARDARLTVPQGADRPTVAGASVEVLNPTTGEATTLPMPAAGWSERPAGVFRYRDPHLAMGPVKVALLRGGRPCKITAHGAGIGLTRDEPFQQSVGVVITSGGRRYCSLFGGSIRANQAGRFVAVRAPVPNTCPGG